MQEHPAPKTGGTEALWATLTTSFGHLTVSHPDSFEYFNQIYFDVSYTPGWTGTDSVVFTIIDTIGAKARYVCVLTVLPITVPVEHPAWGRIKALHE